MDVQNDNEEKQSDGKFWTRHERKQWSIGLFSGCAFLYMCRTVTSITMPAMSKEMGWDKTQSGSVLSAFFWGYALTQLLGGYLSDRLGGDVVLPIAGCFWAMLTFWTPPLAYLSSDKTVTLRLMVAWRVLQGMFQGLHFPSVSSLLSRKIGEKERTFTLSFIFSGIQFGTLLCGFLGSLVLETYGWQCSFYFVGICGIFWVIVMRYGLILKYRQKYQPVVSVEANNLLGENTIKTEETSVPWSAILRSSAFWSIVVGHFCMTNSFHILVSWLPTYFHENFPHAKSWIFNVVPWLITIFSSIFGGWLADLMLTKGYSTTFVRKFIESISAVGVSVSLVAITFTSSFNGSLFCMAMALACNGFHKSGIVVNPQDIAPRFAGSVFGIMNMAGAIPGFVGVYLAGHILETTKSWTAVFNQTAVVCIFGLVVFLMFGTGKRIV